MTRRYDQAPGMPEGTTNLEALRVTAGEHGDVELVVLCDLAEDGDQAAIRRVEEILAETEAEK